MIPRPDWLSVGVFTTGDEASLARGYLETHGIAAAVFDTRTHDAERSVVVLDEWLVKVPPRDVQGAAALLAEAERGRALLPVAGAGPPGLPGGRAR
jgi:hypothetical protein